MIMIIMLMLMVLVMVYHWLRITDRDGGDVKGDDEHDDNADADNNGWSCASNVVTMWLLSHLNV